MSHSTRYVRAAALGAGVALGVFSSLNSVAFAAQKKQAEAAQPQTEAGMKQQAAAAAKNNYESGVKQYQAGKYAPAVENLSAALRGGGLASGDMARALYIRGLAYKKQSKPGLAISDLTSALWLKNGLNDSDRATATAERAEAYRQAGLGDGNTGGESVAVADPNAGAAAAVPSPTPAPAPPVVAETKPSKKKSKKDEAAAAPPLPAPEPVAEITRQAPDSEAAQDAARARKLAAAPVDAGGLTSVASQTLTGSAPAAVPSSPAAAETAVAAVTPSTAPAPAAPVIAPMAAPAVASVPAIPAAATDAPVLSAAPIEQTPAAPDAAAGTSSSPIGKFFSNLFSGSGSAQPAGPTEPVTTASTTPQAATSSWNDQTSVANGVGKDGAAAKGVKQAAAAAAPAAPEVKGGKYKIHIAAVRSRQEAEAIAQKVQAENGAALKSRTASVDEAIIGSMGTFYRVRVGSFANADEPRSVCNSLRTSGFDCLVVTN